MGDKCEDCLAPGTWENKNRREILATISDIPPLVRPLQNVTGKHILIDTLAWLTFKRGTFYIH